MKRALVTGGSGQLGAAVAARAHGAGYHVVAPPRSALDLTDENALRAAVAADQWAVVINCAAYTAVDRAEAEADLAASINHDAARILAEACAERAIPIIHVSTDYVFDGSKTGPYLETDPVSPIGIYGQTKAAGEAAVRAANPRHAIIRTAWVVSAHGNNFIKTMLRLARERDEVGVVNDQRGCPTHAGDLASAILAVADRMTGTPPQLAGTWHFTNAGEASWHDFARFIFDDLEQQGKKRPVLKAISTLDYPTPAKRPANSRLDLRQFVQDFGITPRRWQDAVKDILDELSAREMEALS